MTLAELEAFIDRQLRIVAPMTGQKERDIARIVIMARVEAYLETLVPDHG